MKHSSHILIVAETNLENYFLQQALACRGFKGCRAAATIDQLCSTILGMDFNNETATPLPAVILLDLAMPDALDILRAIRQSRCSQVPVIGLAQGDALHLVQQAFDRGMNSVVFRNQGYDVVSQEIEQIRSGVGAKQILHPLLRTRQIEVLDPICRN